MDSETMKTHSTKLTESDRRLAKRLGNGNLSEGIRVAIRYAAKELKPKRVRR